MTDPAAPSVSLFLSLLADPKASRFRLIKIIMTVIIVVKNIINIIKALKSLFSCGFLRRRHPALVRVVRCGF